MAGSRRGGDGDNPSSTAKLNTRKPKKSSSVELIAGDKGFFVAATISRRSEIVSAGGEDERGQRGTEQNRRRTTPGIIGGPSLLVRPGLGLPSPT
ncbi:hypothetical protein L2E82_05828 [Cichorium intybus]|uniref:Uncharacterized protein n=1 Tax=Cichorium intybus TaxID=13427 RepID=A0ACB9H8W8_CICIN|nr:hypothetical protein L2E82_05828 [Cichorium intybus]